MVMNSTFSTSDNITVHYIRKTPNFVGRGEEFSAALRLRPNTRRVSAGSITPSSHTLSTQKHQIIDYRIL